MVVVLLGAECFDSAGRVVHARGAKEELNRMAGLCYYAQLQMKVVVVAEEYKNVDKKDGTLLDHKRFFRADLAGLDVYPIGTVDCIISDRKRHVFEVSRAMGLRPEITYSDPGVVEEPMAGERHELPGA